MAVTKHQKFETARVWRHEMAPHPRNPRVIEPKSQKRLKEKLQQVGLLDTVVWNRRTGFILSGHQRMAILDKLERYDHESRKNDYELDVAAVDIDDLAELEMLAFFNNPSAQGGFDLDMLADMNLELGVSFEGMGFDAIDVDIMFDGDARFSEIFKDSRDVGEAKQHLSEVKADRARMTDRLKEANSADFYVVVVARDQAELDVVRARLAVEATAQFVSADALFAVIDGFGAGSIPSE